MPEHQYGFREPNVKLQVIKSRLRAVFIVAFAVTATLSDCGPACARVILSPAGLRDLTSLADTDSELRSIVIQNTMGSASAEGASFRDENLFSGVISTGPTVHDVNLTPAYQSGVTDFDSYIASNPRDTSDTGNIWRSATGSPIGFIDFDLGGAFSLDRIALWNVANPDRAVEDFRVLGSNSSDFSSSLLLGDFAAAVSPNTGSPSDFFPQVFDLNTFDDTSYQFVRFQVVSNHGDVNLTQLAELAFRVEPVFVPEPSTFLAGLLCASYVGFMRRRSRQS